MIEKLRPTIDASTKNHTLYLVGGKLHTYSLL